MGKTIYLSLLGSLFLFLAPALNAQDTTYFNKSWRIVKAEDQHYYRVWEKKGINEGPN